MSGGTWTTQNKVLPGVYIRFKSAGGAGLTVSDRGRWRFANRFPGGRLRWCRRLRPGRITRRLQVMAERFRKTAFCRRYLRVATALPRQTRCCFIAQQRRKVRRQRLQSVI